MPFLVSWKTVLELEQLKKMERFNYLVNTLKVKE
jgi:hypothetical protein